MGTFAGIVIDGSWQVVVGWDHQRILWIIEQDHLVHLKFLQQGVNTIDHVSESRAQFQQKFVFVVSKFWEKQ